MIKGRTREIGPNAIAVGGALLAMLIFGGNFVAGRHGALAGLGPADLVALRFAVAGLLFAPFLLRHGLRHLGGIGWPRGATLTVLGGAPYICLAMAGLHFAPAAHGAVLNPGMTTVAGVLLSLIMLGERPAPGAVVGIPVALIGLGLVAGAGLWSAGSDTWLGDTILAATGVSYALFTVLLRKWRIAPLAATAAVNVLSAVIWLPCYAALTRFQPLLAVPIAESIGQAVFQGAFAGGLAVFLYLRAVAALGPSQAVLFPALVPVFGALLAACLLGEPLSAPQGIGIGAVCAGMLTAVWRPRRLD
jgi:drug/metabolite transporter (DMT)-like permease